MSEAAMYSKTRLGSDQAEGALSRTPRGKRFAYLAVAVVAAAGAAVGVWSAVTYDDYATSANGCVSLTVASSTGAGSLHYCGAQARALCRESFAKSDPVSLAARPQCDLAGLTRDRVAAG